jgi:SET domain-containing protein
MSEEHVSIMSESTSRRAPMFRVRNSKIHGKGVFALRRIRRGTRVTEYLGERVSHAEADRRYAHKAEDDNHTFLFIVDGRTVIDAGVNGSDARFINHSCDPNCETVIEDRRVFIEAIRTIQPGEELSYDYQIQREPGDPDDIDEIFCCRCGSPGCRGTMLWPAGPQRLAQSPARRSAGGAGGRKAGGRRTKTRGKAQTHAHGRSSRKSRDQDPVARRRQR